MNTAVPSSGGGQIIHKVGLILLKSIMNSAKQYYKQCYELY
jgi:hypothetical protein